MVNIPPHYTKRFIIQRYNKALHFVQNLPASSSFQPTKNQKLELYALYKQVSEGDINTQRPGLFDVVGRAKWDAWKKLEGMSTLEARHIYVEALLRVAAEAYKKNVGREEAQQIIQAFALIRPSADDEDSDNMDTDDTSNLEEDTSIASEDAEEQAYLRDIQESNNINRTVAPFNTIPAALATDASSVGSSGLQQSNIRISNQSPALTRSHLIQHQQQQSFNRPSSATSMNTMVTAPMTPRQHPTRNDSRSASVASGSVTGNGVQRPRSTVSSKLGQNRFRGSNNEKRSVDQQEPRDTSSTSNNNHEEDFLDDSVNPWQHLPATSTKNKAHYRRQQHNDESSSEDSIDNDSRSRSTSSRPRRAPSSSSTSHMRLPSPMYSTARQQQQRLSSLPSASPPLYPALNSSSNMTPIHTSINRPFMTAAAAVSTSASSSVTATPQQQPMFHSHNHDGINRPIYTSDSRSNSRNAQQHLMSTSRYNSNTNPVAMNDPTLSLAGTTSIISLGPATKRALESLQNEVIALNDRIDGLRRELTERDKQRSMMYRKDNDKGSPPSLSDDNMGEGWKWVFKAAIKYAGVNLMTAFVLFLVLYKSGNPIAYAILKQSSKFWQIFKLKVLMLSNVVV